MLPLYKLSILKRLVLASVIALPMVMLFSAVMLDKAMKNSLITAEHEKLKAQIYQLLTAVEFEPQLYMPEVLAEARFSQLDSGLYGRIQTEKSGRWVSSSADLKDLSKVKNLDVWVEDSETSSIEFSQLALADEDVFAARLKVSWEELDNRPVEFIVMHRQADLQRELASFRWQLLWWLGLLLLGLIVAQTLVLKFGLQPLQQLADEVSSLNEGELEKLSELYPHELKPLVLNMNHLITSLRQQQQRFKLALDDLAHSLKTPLTIVIGEINKEDKLNEQQLIISEQIDRMQDIIQHQLKRANRGVTRLQTSSLPVEPMVNRLCSAMARLYQVKNIKYNIEVSAGLNFLGIGDDLMEVLGNLLENAFKYGKSEVLVSAQMVQGKLHVYIEDDGLGIEEYLKTQLLKRGVRADTSSTGQGIGLSVAMDIVLAYQGGIQIEKSILGGAKFIIILPGKVV